LECTVRVLCDDRIAINFLCHVGKILVLCVLSFVEVFLGGREGWKAGLLNRIWHCDGIEVEKRTKLGVEQKSLLSKIRSHGLYISETSSEG
jgi:hypothetical protein